jgi:hypothetical protein
MVGLTFFEDLSLSYVQYAAILLNMVVWMQRKMRFWKKICIVYSILFVAFWGNAVSVDVTMTFDQLPRLSGLHISQVLDTLGHLNYLKFQPPLWTLFLWQFPAYWIQQCFAVGAGITILCLCRGLLGEVLTSLWAATPLFQLMSIQPSNDLYAILFLLSGVVLARKSCRVSGMACIILACMTKYTSLVVLPFLLPQFGLAMLLIVPAATCYVLVGREYYWGTVQGRYLLHSFSMGVVSQYFTARQAIRHVSKPLYIKLMNNVRWRVSNVSLSSMLSLWFWLFPAYLVRWRAVAYIVLCCLILGYGNIKYLLLLMCLLPQNSQSA